MKTFITATALLMLTSAAHASCWAWVQKGNDLICEVRGPQGDPSYRATEHSDRPGPGTFSPSAYPSAPTTITTRSHITIRSYRQ
jgi:hypothetical protein